MTMEFYRTFSQFCTSIDELKKVEFCYLGLQNKAEQSLSKKWRILEYLMKIMIVENENFLISPT